MEPQPNQIMCQHFQSGVLSNPPGAPQNTIPRSTGAGSLEGRHCLLGQPAEEAVIAMARCSEGP